MINHPNRSAKSKLERSERQELARTQKEFDKAVAELEAKDPAKATALLESLLRDVQKNVREYHIELGEQAKAYSKLMLRVKAGNEILAIDPEKIPPGLLVHHLAWKNLEDQLCEIADRSDTPILISTELLGVLAALADYFLQDSPLSVCSEADWEE